MGARLIRVPRLPRERVMAHCGCLNTCMPGDRVGGCPPPPRKGPHCSHVADEYVVATEGVVSGETALLPGRLSPWPCPTAHSLVF